MERTVTKLFDYRRFLNNTRMQGVLEDVERRYAAALNDDALEMVSAAGNAEAPVGLEPGICDMSDSTRREPCYDSEPNQ